jgi:hypothetical protein
VYTECPKKKDRILKILSVEINKGAKECVFTHKGRNLNILFMLCVVPSAWIRACAKLNGIREFAEAGQQLL